MGNTEKDTSVRGVLKEWNDLVKKQISKRPEGWVTLDCLPGVKFKGLRVISVGTEHGLRGGDVVGLDIKFEYLESVLDSGVTESGNIPYNVQKGIIEVEKEIDSDGNKWFKLDRPLVDLPLGTKARRHKGGFLLKTEHGWFRQEGLKDVYYIVPGSEWDGFVCLPPPDVMYDFKQGLI